MTFFYRLFFFSLLWVFTIPLNGQNKLELKYEKYKNRFQTKFLGKTDNPHQAGNFIPIESIHYDHSVHYADQTWYLGMYLAVLAMEQHIYQKEGKIKKANLMFHTVELDIIVKISQKR